MKALLKDVSLTFFKGLGVCLLVTFMFTMLAITIPMHAWQHRTIEAILIDLGAWGFIARYLLLCYWVGKACVKKKS